jgi:hypothetical protein
MGMALEDDFKKDVAKIVLDKGVLAAILLVLGLWANERLATFQGEMNSRIEGLRQELALAKSRADVRTQVAGAFFTSLSQQYNQVLPPNIDQLQRQAVIAQVEAEARIAVFGAPSVVKAFSSFKSGSMKLSTPDGQRQFLKLVEAVRHDFSEQDDPPSIHADISEIFFPRH